MTALYESRELATEVADKLKVYAQPQRLMILSCLLRGERNVAEIGEATGIAQPALSQQLAELRRAELVSTRKEAKQVWYALADESVQVCVQSMEGVFGGTEPDKLPAQVRKSAVVAPRTVIGAARFARLV
jgi:DNA-binding transcriptional ArsR family regulator